MREEYLERTTPPMSAMKETTEHVVAIGTSTGGTLNKHAGRIGDSPLIGCGTYCDNSVGGVSTTGWGEGMIKVVMAAIMLIVAVSRALMVPVYLTQLQLAEVGQGRLRGADLAADETADLRLTVRLGPEAVQARTRRGGERAAQALSQASSEQASGVEECSASIEEMAASIGQNSDNAKVTNSMATQSASDSRDGGEAVKATVEILIVENAGHNWREIDGSLRPSLNEIIAKTATFMNR